MRSSQVERRQVRMIEVEKMKASAIDDQIRPYLLDKDGFSVLSDKDIFAYAAAFDPTRTTAKTLSQHRPR